MNQDAEADEKRRSGQRDSVLLIRSVGRPSRARDECRAVDGQQQGTQERERERRKESE